MTTWRKILAWEVQGIEQALPGEMWQITVQYEGHANPTTYTLVIRGIYPPMIHGLPWAIGAFDTLSEMVAAARETHGAITGGAWNISEVLRAERIE